MHEGTGVITNKVNAAGDICCRDTHKITPVQCLAEGDDGGLGVDIRTQAQPAHELHLLFSILQRGLVDMEGGDGQLHVSSEILRH